MSSVTNNPQSQAPSVTNPLPPQKQQQTQNGHNNHIHSGKPRIIAVAPKDQFNTNDHSGSESSGGVNGVAVNGTNGHNGLNHHHFIEQESSAPNNKLLFEQKMKEAIEKKTNQNPSNNQQPSKPITVKKKILVQTNIHPQQQSIIPKGSQQPQQFQYQAPSLQQRVTPELYINIHIIRCINICLHFLVCIFFYFYVNNIWFLFNI